MTDNRTEYHASLDALGNAAPGLYGEAARVRDYIATLEAEVQEAVRLLIAAGSLSHEGASYRAKVNEALDVLLGHPSKEGYDAVTDTQPVEHEHCHVCEDCARRFVETVREGMGAHRQRIATLEAEVARKDEEWGIRRNE